MNYPTAFFVAGAIIATIYVLLVWGYFMFSVWFTYTGAERWKYVRGHTAAMGVAWVGMLIILFVMTRWIEAQLSGAS